MKRIMVDMSATLIHHGHIRLLCKAKDYGSVIVGLTTDEEIKKSKGYWPELNFSERREILEAIHYVSEVVPSKWLIDDKFLDLHKIDLLVHGDDNRNCVSSKRILVFPRTAGVSSSILREKIIQSSKVKNQHD
jgi:cytidyltransferase-like protein